MSLYEKTVKTEDIYDGKILKLRLDTVELSDGTESKREIVEHNGGVCVLAVTEKREVVLVRQFRKALEKELLELPAGKLEKGEDPLECAKRELEEETGYIANSLELLYEFYSAPGFCTEKVYIYLAKDLDYVGAKLDDGEHLEVEKYSLDEIESLLKKLEDAKTIIAFLHLLKHKEAI